MIRCLDFDLSVHLKKPHTYKHADQMSDSRIVEAPQQNLSDRDDMWLPSVKPSCPLGLYMLCAILTQYGIAYATNVKLTCNRT